MAADATNLATTYRYSNVAGPHHGRILTPIRTQAQLLLRLSLMGRRLRLWEPQNIYSCVENSVDRQFLFRPDHRTDNHLLRWDCPPDALNTDNDTIPEPSIINTIGAAIVRAQKKHPVDIFWFEGNINHQHSGIGAKDGGLDALSKFKQQSNSIIARGINKTLDREGHVFGATFHSEPCLDDNATEQKLFYSVTNVVKDGLVNDVINNEDILSRHICLDGCFYVF